MTIVLLHLLFAVASIGVGALALVATKFSKRHTRLGEIYHWLMLITCVTALALSYSRGRATIFTYLTPPSYAFALLGYLMAKYRPAHWLEWHITGQCSSYIALMAGVLFQLLPRIGIRDFWLTLLPPIVVGTLLIIRTQRKWAKVSSSRYQAGFLPPL
jgi:hypothetical protein